jgi:hypothetical protein
MNRQRYEEKYHEQPRDRERHCQQNDQKPKQSCGQDKSRYSSVARTSVADLRHISMYS